ncbi:Acetyl-coenzyme A synthetase [Starkeya nomas]|uniref:acetate--CoA ligase n=2 Tax=Xanthobacteraceae TaxID=335928 RepID=A0A5S9PVK1_9HYPH|nr:MULTISPECIES: AMP-binding protein [Xanthobacteraceae]TSJ63965.1 AMP-binding protein [Ancylobacter moscoviensis]CAA0108317.1 Acetyl-coenzyme A synthetase [Starkeya nomas]
MGDRIADAEAEFAWVPDAERIAGSRLTEFIRAGGCRDFDELYRRADADPGWFWEQVIRFGDLRFERPYDRIMDDSRGIEWTRWCVGGTTNMAANCIDRHRGTPTYDQTYIVSEAEDGTTRSLTYREFDAQVCRFAGVLHGRGIGPGDVVGLLMPLIPETFVAYFAIVKLGAIVMPLFSGFAPGAIAERFNMTDTKIVVTTDVMYRRGSSVRLAAAALGALPESPSVEHVIVLNRTGGPLPDGPILDWDEAMKTAEPVVETLMMDAEAPAVLHMTSGTTGRPKGAIYTHIGFVTKMVLDYGILSDFRPTDRYLYQADMGWMVGSQTAVIASVHGASMLLAEGVPDYPEPDRFWRLIERHKVTWVGITPSMARILMAHSDKPPESDLSSLRIVLTAAEPWTVHAWNWLFHTVLKGKVPMLNVSGGTEISGCILACSVNHPLKVGSFAIPIPGMGADIVDENGNPTAPGEIGELVLRRPSIGLTPGLWRDDKRYIESYWSTLPGVWVHGDLASRDEDGHWYIHGRSDDTMKIAGKRVGPAEIETAVMASRALVEAAAVSVPDPIKGAALVLACVPLPGVEADDALRKRLQSELERQMGKSYRAEKIIFVRDLPKTRTLKIMRRAVRASLLRQSPGDLSALTNPDSLAELQQQALF